MKVIYLFFIFLVFIFEFSVNADTIHVPDDFTSIQDAIDSSSPGDVVLVRAGAYSERLILKPDVILRSFGCNEPGKAGLARAEATILNGGGETSEQPGVTMAEGSVLDGFTVTGMGKFDETEWQRHWEEKGENQSHDEIGHFGTPAIAVSGVNCRIINNIVHHNGHTGIVIEGKKGKDCSPTIADNICYRNMGGGIGSINGSTAIIRNNTCYENFFAGIGHNNASPYVLNNECYGNIRAGIGVSNGASPILRGNRCYQNRRAGIGIRTGNQTQPVVEDNDCYENFMAGIGCAEGSSPIIRNNRCFKNKLAGIGSDSANPTIINNKIYENLKAGVGLSHGSKALILGNECKENKLVALGVRDGSEAMVKGNVFQRSEGMPPIIALFKQSKILAIDNDIIGGGIAGILNQGNLIAENNNISGQNGGNGILIGKEASASLKNNRITGYRNQIQDQREKNQEN